MITNRPSTKLHAPPGGASTISFGDPYSTTPKNSTVAASKNEPKPAGGCI
jgi:hypothetical protein